MARLGVYNSNTGRVHLKHIKRSLPSHTPPHVAGKPDRVDAGKPEREAKPGDGVLEVVVRQVDSELARLGQAAGRHRRLLFDIERRGGRSEEHTSELQSPM